MEELNDLVSVIIPTYNRFSSLLKAIESVRKQSYKNKEIIIINDASTQKEYYNYDFGEDIILINLPVNMRIKYGCKAAQGMTRNEGINIANGKWISFLDDDDYWFPTKLEIQINNLNKYKKKICSTNYLVGKEPFNKNNIKKYERKLLINEEFLEKIEDNIYNIKVKKFNYMLNSTIIVDKKLLNRVGNYSLIDGEDWDLWNKIFDLENFIFINDDLIYYDDSHAGQSHYIYDDQKMQKMFSNDWNSSNK